MKIAVVDGQGGGIGRLMVEKLRNEFGEAVRIIALGTNALATSMMLKAGANEGASGENAVKYCAGRVDIIVGSISIIAANSFAGELSPAMAEAIASSDAAKILVPVNRSGIDVAGVYDESLPMQVDSMVALVKQRL